MCLNLNRRQTKELFSLLTLSTVAGFNVNLKQQRGGAHSTATVKPQTQVRADSNGPELTCVHFKTL